MIEEDFAIYVVDDFLFDHPFAVVWSSHRRCTMELLFDYIGITS